jgi:hypothetical protein
MIAKFKTNGKGFWTKAAKEVSILFMEEVGRELRVYFDIASWSVKTDGLIYTDPLFLKDLKIYLTNQGKKYADKIDYSENGMQGDDYVSLDLP